MFSRSVSAAAVVVCLFAFPSLAVAGDKDTPAPAASTAPAEHPHDGGIIGGKITAVDYRRNVLTVNKTDISVMPSTQIQGNDSGYHVFTDLKLGMSVDVYTSQIAGKYIAQIITLR